MTNISSIFTQQTFDHPEFRRHELSRNHSLLVGQLPIWLLPNPDDFELLWKLHPDDFPQIKIGGRLVKTRRWQQAYGADYHYGVNKALPTPPELCPFERWVRGNISPDFNGLLVNWFDGRLGHYIGPHRDSAKNMIPGAPIVSISLGQERTFRLRPWPRKLKGEPIDFPAVHGTVFVMPCETNQAFTHEIPRRAGQTGKSISITLRCFVPDFKFSPELNIR